MCFGKTQQPALLRLSGNGNIRDSMTSEIKATQTVGLTKQLRTSFYNFIKDTII